jgi:hypothetical protein
MSAKNRKPLADRVIEAAEAALAAQDYVSPVDVFIGIGWTTRAKSPRHSVVVRFSRSRRRYERQGLLVEPQALAQAQRELAEPTR